MPNSRQVLYQRCYQLGKLVAVEEHLAVDQLDILGSPLVDSSDCTVDFDTMGFGTMRSDHIGQVVLVVRERIILTLILSFSF